MISNALKSASRSIGPIFKSRCSTLARPSSTSFASLAITRSAATSSFVSQRSFTSSSPIRASESDENLPPGMDKLMNNPEALSAISNLMSKMQENGIDLKSGERPSMAQLAKLAVKEDVREATAKVVEALQKAGIEISPEAMQQALGMDSDDGGDKK